MTRPKAILFDLDDTLLDMYSAMHRSWEEICADVAPGLGCDASSLRETIRRESALFWADEGAVAEYRVKPLESRTIVVRLSLLAMGLDDSGAEEIAGRSLRGYLERVAPFDDAIGTLETLRSQGYRLGMVTNGSSDTQRQKIGRWQLEPYFDEIVIESEFGRGKPDPGVFRQALAGTGASPDEAWMVGDNLYADIGGAQGVGVHSVWIHRERLEFPEDPPAHPHRRIGHFDELHAALADAQG
ncbi:MAG: HAD-IA family hydrolase [Dehalococcoidia bacterium]|nr:HAD-IA family hydrolase [Dehalococcoidia bacterium]MYD28673.1 HAD-IA family hydrolase [Dehalococcoidia bacterium]